MKYFFKTFIEIKLILLFIINYFPGYIGIILRRLTYKLLFKKLGKRFTTDIGFKTNCSSNIKLGDNASFMRGCSINSCDGTIKIGNNISVNQNVDINASDGGEIKIGDDVLIGNNVIIRAANHIYKNKKYTINKSGHTGGKIEIGNNVWIGANSVILRNVIIEDNSVISAGTVVSKNVNKNEIAFSNKQENKKIIYE